MAAVAATTYELPLVLELMCYDENMEGFLKKAYEAGDKLTGMYWEAKGNQHTGI